MYEVCVVGLGQVGLPTAMYIQERGLNVIGYDVSLNAIKKARRNSITAYCNWDDVPECKSYLICVTTSINRDKPELSALFDVSFKISKVLKANTLISIESTVPVGTCRNIFNNIFKNQGLLIHVPHRYWSGDPINFGVKQPRVLGAVNDISLRAGLSLYSDILHIPLYEATSIEIAEMSKIVENAYRFIQIAFAEEFRMICEEQGLTFSEVRNACNTKWNIEILEAREGIGGHCLSKDVRYSALLSEQSILPKAAIEADKKYISWLTTRASAREKIGDTISTGQIERWIRARTP